MKITAAFKDDVRGELVPIFREMLRKVAEKRGRGTAGDAVWVLRDEFR